MSKFKKVVELLFVVFGLVCCLDLYLEQFTGSGLNIFDDIYIYIVLLGYSSFSFTSRKYTDFNSYFKQITAFEMIFCLYVLSQLVFYVFQ